jgi:hypothetical protein
LKTRSVVSITALLSLSLSSITLLILSRAGAAGEILDTVLKRDTEEDLVKRDVMEDEVLYERDFPELDARYFDGDEIEARSFDDMYELEARAFDDSLELEARSWDFEEEEE